MALALYLCCHIADAVVCCAVLCFDVFRARDLCVCRLALAFRD